MIEFQGYCYKLIGTNRLEGVTWEDAGSKCEELGAGYNLASIHSERESAFLYTMLAQLNLEDQDTNFWISANDRDREDEWCNSDGTPFDYTHWGDGEPNGDPPVRILHYLPLFSRGFGFKAKNTFNISV